MIITVAHFKQHPGAEVSPVGIVFDEASKGCVEVIAVGRSAFMAEWLNATTYR